MIGEAVIPAGAHLFQINEEDPISLDEKAAVEFHYIVYRLLFLSKRACRCLQTDVAFLCTRVQKPDTDDYKKLSRNLKYFRTIASLTLILGMDGNNTASWWVDGAFATHNYMKSHRGDYMSLRIGAAYASSSKQKLNTHSYTEADLVAADESIPQVLWNWYFLEEQGYGINDNILYQ